MLLDNAGDILFLGKPWAITDEQGDNLTVSPNRHTHSRFEESKRACNTMASAKQFWAAVSKIHGTSFSSQAMTSIGFNGSFVTDIDRTKASPLPI